MKCPCFLVFLTLGLVSNFCQEVSSGRKSYYFMQSGSWVGQVTAVFHALMARLTKDSIFRIHRPQQLSSSIPSAEAISSGVKIPDRPNSRTRDSVIPLHKQTNILFLLLQIKLGVEEFGIGWGDIDN
jgi:hypothetical protein